MNTDAKVLACVDQSHFADYVADYAVWAATRMDAPLAFLHILDRHPEIATGNDHSGTIGFGFQEALLTKLSDEDEVHSRDAREQGRLFLNRLRQRAIAQGLSNADVRQRHGALGQTLAKQEEGVRLFVLGQRGESAEATHRDLGRNVEQMVRALHRPILAVTEGFKEPRRAMVAFDGKSVTRKGVEMIATSPLFRDLPVHLLMSGKPHKDGSKQLDWAKGLLEATGIEAPTALIPGDAERSIAEYVQQQDIDLLIMGAYAHSPPRSLLIGSKTTDLLRSAKIPTLLLR